MRRIANIGSLLKKIYRLYSIELLKELQNKGYNDLRPSFLEILMYLCENPDASIKKIGEACGLKKQTMTSHLNELERRGYTERKNSLVDKREQLVAFTDYGEKFKLVLLQVIQDLEKKYSKNVGEVEMDRVELILNNLHEELLSQRKRGPLI